MYIYEKKLRLEVRKRIDMQEALIHYHFIHSNGYYDLQNIYKCI